MEVDSKKMKWGLTMRIATSQKERWMIKAAEWSPELSSKYRTNRSIDRPRKRWEDDINEFLKQIEDETENLTAISNNINKNWINTAKDRGRRTLLEEKDTEFSYQNEMKVKKKSKELKWCAPFLKVAAQQLRIQHRTHRSLKLQQSAVEQTSRTFSLTCDVSRTTWRSNMRVKTRTKWWV